MKIYAMSLLLAIFVGQFLTEVQAQEGPVLHLNEEHLGQTFTIETGTIIEVRLLGFPELYVSYDPVWLQFLDYTPPVELSGTVESGVIQPDEVVPPPLPTEIPSETGTGSVGVGEVITAEGGVVTQAGGDEVSSEEARSTWRFLAIGAGGGETVLELRTFYPPCPPDQPCPMMPDFNASFNLIIEGDPVVLEPDSVEGQVILVVQLQPADSTASIDVQSGQIILFDVSELRSPFRVIYHPVALRLLAGDNLRFLVNPWGMMTRIGVQTADDQLLVANLLIAPECDSCGVR